MLITLLPIPCTCNGKTFVVIENLLPPNLGGSKRKYACDYKNFKTLGPKVLNSYSHNAHAYLCGISIMDMLGKGM